MEHASDAVLVVDDVGFVMNAMGSVCDVFGCGAEELTGINPRDLIHPDDLQRCRALVARTQDDPALVVVDDMRVVRTDGREVVLGRARISNRRGTRRWAVS